MAEQLEPQTPQDEQLPKPKRKRRWARLLVVLAIIIALPVVAWLGWYGYAAWSLAAEVQRLRDAGEPMDLSDFDRPAIPDEQNAAVLYKQALDTIHKLVEASQSGGTVPWRSQDSTLYALQNPDDAIAVLEPYRAALAQLRGARSRSGLHWGCPLGELAAANSEAWKATPWSRMREAMQTLALAAGGDRVVGDDAEAIRRCFDMLSLAESANDVPVMIGELVTIACRRVACSTLEVLTPELKVGQGAENASREQVRELIAHLLDADARGKDFAGSCRGERAFILASDQDPGDGPNILMTPPCLLGVRDAVRVLTVVINDRGRSAWSEMQPKLTQIAGESTGEGFLSEPSWARQPSIMASTPRLYYGGEAQMRMAAVALAIRLYEIDHGQRPEALAALVPDYLDALPTDPFDPAGGTFRYLPQAERPRLYSLGADCIDHGGITQMERGQAGAGNLNDVDQVFFLNGADEATGNPMIVQEAQLRSAGR